ncbi:MAG: cytochrome P450, partial [Pseudomonadota bacterium]
GAPAPRLTRVVLSPFLTNRDPRVFSDPARFNPDRWIDHRRDPYEMTAFSAGPRVCPGSWFGHAMVKTALAALLSKRAVMLRDKTQIDYVVGVTLSPKSAIAAQFADAPPLRAPILEGRIQRLFKLAA